MKIEIIPATDIIGGACVRLTQGDYGRRTTYYRDPLKAAQRFEEAGIRRLHMVDLDGAKASEPRNLAVLERVATKTTLEVQYGGGIKSRGALRSVFGAGASRAICGSIAVREPESFAEWLAEFGGGKLILGADIRDGAGAYRPIRTAGARAGHLHRHRPRRDAVRHLGGILRWVAGAVPRGGNHRERRHRLDDRHRGARRRGAAQRNRRQSSLRRTYHPRRTEKMLAKRIIPCLDIREGQTVKGINFVGLRNVGDPVELGAKYAAEGADELVYLDISATEEGRQTFTELVARIAERIDIPFTVGGGIASVADAGRLLDAGADKVTVNSAAVRDPALIDAIASKYGSQFVVAAIDARMTDGVWRVTTHGGKRMTDRELFAWAHEVCQRGAGELLFTSMDHDGTRDGYPCETFARLAELPIPLIASGGAGSVRHIADVLTLGRADAALAASIFHYNGIPIPVLKRELHRLNINVRQ